MFAKIFSQIYDSSIVENPEARFTFMDLLVLADINGVVDMTHEAIARRTNRPIEVIRETIRILESPDGKSRTPDENGVRLLRLDDHRDWGWEIVNYQKFRDIASEEQRREKTKLRTRKWRQIKEDSNSVTPRDATVTGGDDSPSPSASASSCSEGGAEQIKLSQSEIVMYDKCIKRIDAELKSLEGAYTPKKLERIKWLRAEKVRVLAIMKLGA